MKRLFIFIVVCMAILATAPAQDQAIGLRLGGGSSFGGEFSYQKSLGDVNRLELDLGLEYQGLAITGIYQWTWDLNDLGDGFGWYAGVGGGVRMFNGFGLGINGQIGIEYTLPGIPLKFSLDTRPGWYAGNGYGFGYGAALGVRYLF